MVLGLNPGGGEIFRTCPDRPWGPPSLLYNGYRVFPGCKERPGCDADPSPPSSPVGHERVELYLYSPYGPYGLYRASVPVQGCTLRVTIRITNRCDSLYYVFISFFLVFFLTCFVPSWAHHQGYFRLLFLCYHLVHAVLC